MDGLVNQRTRVLILIIEISLILLMSYLALNQIIPPATDKGYWFYTALFTIIVGDRLLTPFFIKPIDVIAYSAPALIALIYLWSSNWVPTEQIFFGFCFIYCASLLLASFVQIITKDSQTDSVKHFSESVRVTIGSLGHPQAIYSVIMWFFIYTYHRQSATEVFWIAIAWALTVATSPIEHLIKSGKRIYWIWKDGDVEQIYGQIVAFQKPNVILFREAPGRETPFGATVLIKDSTTKDKIGIALDYVGRDEGILRRCVEIDGLTPAAKLSSYPLPDQSISSYNHENIDSLPKETTEMLGNAPLLKGIVGTNTTLNRLVFEEIGDRTIEEGQLVKTLIYGRPVIYQIVGGKTDEEQVYKKNMNGITKVEAQKIGQWIPERKHFELVKWLPQLNSPVFAVEEEQPERDPEAIGYFPRSNYAAHIKSVHELVTHNAAIIGILGIGKSSLSFELIERMLSQGIKVICMDLTDEYAEILKDFCHVTSNDQLYLDLISTTGAKGKENLNAIPEQGGNRPEFSEAVEKLVQNFIHNHSGKNLLVFNPSQYEVWRQYGQYFGKGGAAMASLSATEITSIFTEAALKACQGLGKVEVGKARVCVVYEEAHSLIPEWNTVVSDGDKSATNATARAILQGRKFGLGCLVISQRTANVTKTILNQCNTIFAMRTFDDTGKDFLANYIGSEYADSLPNLQERHAVFFGKASKCENPIMIRLNDREHFLKLFREKFPIPQPQAQVPSIESFEPEFERGVDFEDDIPY
ncbi:MAG: hypothetical protein CVU15_00975 [Betaproteobacteria bacterium HGW-Betaproteobacteria-1]|jgi:hypothetical protein|nr:MAG: hypothetical protein CVU15_00975 [Betaproteobacteria bacterium HGW-Betaproteobacteria-1]